MTNSVFVRDQPNVPPDKRVDVLLWQSYADNESFVSIPRYLETHAERLRAKYLAFIHDLGETQIKGRRVVDHLNMGGDFSFWWMTTLAEKSPFKSPKIYDCLRFMALEEILLERKPADLTLDSNDRALAGAMRILCQNLHIKFFWRPEKKSTQKHSLRSLFDAFPYPIQGLIGLGRHIILRWPLRKLQKPEWFSGDDAIFFCSYFFNLDAGSCDAGKFYSRQWEALPHYLQDSGKRTNWIHHLVFNAGGPNTNKALGWLRQFNRDTARQGCHAFLDTFLSNSVVLRAFKTWLSLNIIRWRLRKISSAFTPKGSAVCLWPLLQREWLASMSGTVALNNCMWVELFNAAFRDIPHQELGLYLWENQGWESALLHAWRRHGHGRIIGVPHATIVFWHLNNFDDARSLSSTKICAKPLPDQLAVNGPMAWEAFASTGYPVERFAKVEALRFQYLLKLDADKAERQDNSQASGNVSANGPKKILILGDFTFRQTVKMLSCVEAASLSMGHEISFTLKPHPASRIEKDDYPSLRFDLTYQPLAEIIHDFDYAFSSNTSSAGLDALLAGLPVVVYLDDENFNNSPLRGIGGVRFVSAGDELAAALQSIERDGVSVAVRDFFWLDNRLSRWHELLLKAKISG